MGTSSTCPSRTCRANSSSPPSRRSPSTKTSLPSSKKRPPDSPSRTSSKPRTSHARATCAPRPVTYAPHPHHTKYIRIFLQCNFCITLLRRQTHPHIFTKLVFNQQTKQKKGPKCHPGKILRIS